MSPAHLVWIATGAGEFQTQALYSIYSALSFRGDSHAVLHVYTDAPEHYRPVEQCVRVHALSTEKQRALRGPHDVPYRMQERPGERVLFVDADTFFFGPLAALLARIDNASALMHRREWHVATARTGQLRRFRRHLRQVRFRGAPIELRTFMWNSGVIGVDGGHADVLAEVLELVDTFWSRYPEGFIEQFAVGWRLEKAGIVLRAADDAVFHYWFQKPAYLQAIRQRLDGWREAPLQNVLAELRASRIVLPAPPLRVSLWEKIASKLRGEPIQDVRGLAQP
jgi:hypothetical protein